MLIRVLKDRNARRMRKNGIVLSFTAMMPTRYPGRHQRVSDLTVTSSQRGETPHTPAEIRPGSFPGAAPPQRGILGDTDCPLPRERRRGFVIGVHGGLFKDWPVHATINRCKKRQPRTSITRGWVGGELVPRTRSPAARSRNSDNTHAHSRLSTHRTLGSPLHV